MGNSFAKKSGAKGILRALDDFGQNPGALAAKYFLPEALGPNAPLVVVLHGCTQTAEQYDQGAGWSTAAQEYGFALLYPEQQRSNNPNLCFNWFLPQDNRRDRGEALSIRSMIAAMIERHHLDPTRIYVTGLSAGGAMANVLLATYPELFDGGAIIAGLPYGTATNVPQALERMQGRGLPALPDLAALVHHASDRSGDWPTLSVWHGSADTTVHPANAEAIVTQWRAVQGLSAQATRQDRVDGCARETWVNSDGRPCLQSITIPDMGHGTPIAQSGPDACGSPAPYILDRNISSTRHICRFWGLTSDAASTRDAHCAAGSSATALRSATTSPDRPAPSAPADVSFAAPSRGVGKVIEDALRAAGLMR
jgi:poly(hydroxyalkanoate) depolymerase family esterase